MKRDTPQGIPTQQPSLQLEIQRTNSPKYLPSLTGSPNNHGSYNSSDRKLRSAQAVALPPSPPTVHQNVPYMEPLRPTPPQVVKLHAQLPTQSVKAQTPHKSLPVQEEPEDGSADEQNDNQEQERDRLS